MNIEKVGKYLAFVQWVTPFGYYLFVVQSDLSFRCQYWIYLLLVLCLACFYWFVDSKFNLNNVVGFEAYLIFTIISQITAGSLSFDEMKHIGLNFSADIDTAYEQYFFMKLLFNLVGMSLLPVAFNHITDKFKTKNE
ncbi:hypothetical protein [Lonepinella koalarum]|uniref:Uncharacterized protein n=1 Tax=Lonepinella koalarum TaxID=53417 RepID=A0A4R1KXJ6_9PAST|nr:hypothetical protein [Lonepinella koalarum]MDH2925574.1 hypothetical protein [Lonepinella koalarum]MDH2927270.1 hypothetical protein [Lonepinella koalarum]MDH2927294.1 hypothetical protein [Lonepinella koalarum]MDH2927936.1 hypothetical protein [Lonepinella koalarum]TCK70135.1 hypothetical protein EV692_1362 [Lonepinella koalarum]